MLMFMVCWAPTADGSVFVAVFMARAILDCHPISVLIIKALPNWGSHSGP